MEREFMEYDVVIVGAGQTRASAPADRTNSDSACGAGQRRADCGVTADLQRRGDLRRPCPGPIGRFAGRVA